MLQSAAVLSRLFIGGTVLAMACTPTMAEKSPSGSTQASSRPPTKCPQASAKPIDMAKLAWLAEKADGKRNQIWRLVVDKKGDPQLLELNELNGDVSCEVNVKVKAEGKVRDRVVDTVRVHARDTTSGRDTTLVLTNDSSYDAVFWTQSAVEKFVWPYYHSQRLWDSTLEAVKKKYTENQKTFAVAHQAPSRSSVTRLATESAAQELYIATDTGGGRVVWQPALEFVGMAPKSK